MRARQAKQPKGSGMIDYIFRYDPTQAEALRPPTNSEEARARLIAGNRVFSQWMSTCLNQEKTEGGSQYVIPCTSVEFDSRAAGDGFPVQRPFAVVLGCSDARVPTEMLLGQGFNDLFVVRVAGNVMGEQIQGSIDFSIHALAESVRVLVVLGHTNCGAVKGAVDAYLEPKKFWSRSNSAALRSIIQEIFVAVRESDNMLRDVWGREAPRMPGYRGTLLDMTVCLNAAHTAFALRQQVESGGNWDIEVLYGAYDIRTHQVCMPVHPIEVYSPENVNLATAPSNPRDFASLLETMARNALRVAQGNISS